jgi:DNA polymerase-4
MERIILHIDMNAFFASVEQQSNPALRGKPVAVSGSESRTVILTASYEARAYGVKTGMTLWEARQKCPELILVPTNNRLYTWVSSRIIDIMRDYTPLVEVFSIDEAFLDITGSVKLFGGAERICALIKSRIKADFGITCSIGVAPNKLLAKLASDMQKPDGLTVIGCDEIATVLERLPIRELCGIGRKTEQQLLMMGIRTCGELGRYDLRLLEKKFGVVGRKLHFMGRGIDNSPVVAEEEAEEVKSVGHSTTLKKDLTERDDILKVLLQLSEMVGRRARRYGVAGKTVHLTIRYADFTTFQKQEIQPAPLSNSRELYRAAAKILDTIDLAQPVRLLGVSISTLRPQGEQLPLFPEERTGLQLTEAMDKVNNRHGDFTVMFGSLLDQHDKGSHVISPAWKPEGIRNVGVD